MYTGVYKLEIDTRKKIAVPKKIMHVLRKNKSKHLFMTRGIDRCIACYDQQGWDSFKSSLGAMNGSEKEKSILIRQQIGRARNANIDWKQRITIDDDLLNWAGITTQRIVVVGCGDFFEIWDPNEYEEMKQLKSSIWSSRLPF